MSAGSEGGRGEPGQRDRGAAAQQPAPGRPATEICCPFCGSSETEKQSDFGTSLMVRLHYCRGCRTSFEAVKWGDNDGLDLPDFLRQEHAES